MTARHAGRFPFPRTAIDVVTVVASGGGLDALTRVLAPLPADFPAAVVIVQHLCPTHKSLLASILAGRTDLPVKEAATGDRLAPGHVYVAPPNWHALVLRVGTLALVQTPRVRHPGRPGTSCSPPWPGPAGRGPQPWS